MSKGVKSFVGLATGLAKRERGDTVVYKDVHGSSQIAREQESGAENIFKRFKFQDVGVKPNPLYTFGKGEKQNLSQEGKENVFPHSS